MMSEISIGQIYEDLDLRSNYDTLPDGGFPIPLEYEGLLGRRQRRVVVEAVDSRYVYVRNLHDQRASRINRKYFRESSTGRRGWRLVHD